MGNKQILLGALVLGLLLSLAVGPGLAQGPEEEMRAQPELAIEAAVNSKFSYQGVLKEGGGLVNGSRDMVFRLYTDDACTSQIGDDIARPGVAVANGLFTVEVEVDQSHFNGQGLWLEVEVDSTAIACQEILPVPYALGLRPGAVVNGSGTTTLAAYSSDKYALWAETAATADWYTAVRGKAVGTTGITSGVLGTSDSDQGRGVFGQANAESGITYGVYGHSLSSSDLARGVYGLASAESGLTYGVRGDSKSVEGQGVHGRAMATSGETYGVYGKSESADGGGGGYFAGYSGVYGLGTGAAGYGGYFESDHYGVYVPSAGHKGVYVYSAGSPSTYYPSTGYNGLEVEGAQGDGVHVGRADSTGVQVFSAGTDGVYVYGAGEHGVRVGSAGKDGVSVGSAGSPSTQNPSADYNGFEVAGAQGDGLYVGRADNVGVNVWSAGTDGVAVYMAGDDGVQVWEAADDGVYADTTDPNHEYGVYTNDKIHAGEGVTSSGSWLIVAQSSDSRDLETGDVVAVSGMGTPLAGGRSPVPLVQATGQADSTAVVGVVYRRLVVEEEVEEVEHEGQVERRTQLHARSAEGPIAPGDHVLVAVMGPAQVKADPSQGEIHPGDLVTASTQQGQAMKAQPVEIGGAKVYTPGSIIGKAMEPLDASRGTGFIWVWVTLQ